MSAGRDVRGIKRGHQFDKVEMYIYCKPEDSPAAFEKMVADAEQTCAQLGLPYRIKQLCTATSASVLPSPTTSRFGRLAVESGWRFRRYPT